jgi:hypothetical protein
VVAVAPRSVRGTRLGCFGGSRVPFAGRNVGQTQFPGMAHNSARRKKQSLQVVSVRFATAGPRLQAAFLVMKRF